MSFSAILYIQLVPKNLKTRNEFYIYGSLVTTVLDQNCASANMLLLFFYNVKTEIKRGRENLRRGAKICGPCAWIYIYIYIYVNSGRYI